MAGARAAPSRVALRRWWPLIIIVLVGTIPRLVPMFAQFPYGHHSDEPRNLRSAAMVNEGSLKYGEFTQHYSYAGRMYNLGAVSRHVVPALMLTAPLVVSALAVVKAEQDPWGEARNWVEEHVPAGSTIALDSYTPWIPPDRYALVVPFWELITLSVDDLQPRGATYAITSDTQSGRYGAERYGDQRDRYRELFDRSCEVASFNGNDETIMVLSFDSASCD